MELRDQRVVVIGGSSGIGLATARGAQAAGAAVTIVSRSAERLASAQSAIHGVQTVAADIADEAAITAVFGCLDRVDHLVISAGTLRRGAIVANTLENLRAIVEERLWGAVYAVRAAAPKMAGGSITLFSGSITSRPHPLGAMSTVVLSAVEAMAHALAVELAPIRVNTITPGLVDTPLQGAPSPERDERLQAQAQKIPARHIGTSDDIAQVVLMLMTNPYMTGEVIHVDGGGRYV